MSSSGVQTRGKCRPRPAINFSSRSKTRAFCQMPEIPRQQIIYRQHRWQPPDDSHRRGRRRETIRGPANPPRVWRSPTRPKSAWNTLQSSHSLGCHASVTCRRLGDDFLRNHTCELPALLSPPFLCEPLPPSCHRIAAGPRHQITHHARLDVNGSPLIQ